MEQQQKQEDKGIFVNLMIKLFGINWRTTLAGYFEAGGPITWAFIDAYQSGAFNEKHGIALAISIIMIIRGHISKDAKVTGLQTTENPNETNLSK